jgi:acetyl-CoA acetyltransferase
MPKGTYEGVYIAGAGQTTYRKRTDEPLQRVLWEAADRALRSATLGWKDVDGLGVTSFMLPPDNVTVLAEHFGLAPRWLFQGAYGGASAIIGVLHAARAIQAGDAEVVLCVAADVFDVSTHNDMIDRSFNAPLRDYMAPYAFGGANGMFALHTRLYMERYGTAPEDFGRLALAQRSNALLNPNALFKTPLTMDDYLGARPIAEPLRLYDCVLPCCGGDAVVVCSERIADRLDVPRVSILGGGEQHNHPADELYSLRAGWETFSARMYDQAGFGPKDMDFAQLYDDYPVMEFFQLEGLGFCHRGEAAQFVRRHGAGVGDPLPINTGGGQLSASGGMIGLFEAMTQLRGEAGARQVKCRRGIASGFGMVSYGRGLSSSAAILARADGKEGRR